MLPLLATVDLTNQNSSEQTAGGFVGRGTWSYFGQPPRRKTPRHNRKGTKTRGGGVLPTLWVRATRGPAIREGASTPTDGATNATPVRNKARFKGTIFFLQTEEK